MSITIESFQKLCHEALELEAKIDDIKKTTLKPLDERLRQIDRQIIQALEDHNMNTFKGDFGSVTKVRRSSVTIPKTPADKEALFSWLKERGDDYFYAYATVDSRSVNALYKREYEAAKERGDFDFTLPGVGEPTFTDTISRRKK